MRKWVGDLFCVLSDLFEVGDDAILLQVEEVEILSKIAEMGKSIIRRESKKEGSYFSSKREISM